MKVTESNFDMGKKEINREEDGLTVVCEQKKTRMRGSVCTVGSRAQDRGENPPGFPL